MSSGNRRKGGNNSRRGVKDLDEDFNRSSKLLVTRNGTVTTGGERQLFNPRSDNPIAFNKAAAAATTTATIIQKEEIRIQTRQLSRRSTSPPPIKRNGDSVNKRPPPASGRKLRSTEDDSPPVVVSASAAKTAKPAKTNGVQEPSKPIKKKVDSSKKEKKSTGTETAKPLTEEEQAKELQRKKWKSLVASLRTIETKLETLTATSRNLSCFNDEEKEPKQDHNRRQVVDQAIDTQDIVLVEQDVIDAEKIWKEKIQLHLSLGEKYLEILNCDLEYAEKKGLESLCWKRAVYSLVDQFRRALKKSASDDAAAAAVASAATATTNNAAIVSLPAPQSELAAMLFDDDEDEFNTDNLTEIPVINEGGGLTFIRVEKPKPTEAENQGQQQNDKLHQKQTNMILTLFLEYLDLADGFYQKLTLFLKSVDDEEDNEMENYLNKWRRTRKYKWYTCIPLRGDLARYRWTYTPNEIVPMEINNDDVQYDDMTTQAVTKWTNYQAFQEAWKRYFLGIWLMPAKGNLYFNLSLLLQQKTAHPGYEFHKLYFSTRSLMVRRNGFLNARESMLVLFEGNRRWIHKHLQVGSSSTSKQNKKGRSSSKLSSASNNNNNNKLSLTDKDATIPALFVRLHGMLFTKIGLDEFSKIKRLFFDELFYQQKKEDKSSPVPPNNTKQEQQELSQSHIFWFETIITCLSSLYTYDYANSKLTELLSSNSVKLFYPDTSDEVHHQQHQTLLEDLGESILFTFEIDLICQIAVQLFQRYIDAANLALPTTPVLPKLPHVSLTFRDNKKFLFGDGESKQAHLEDEEKHQEDTLAWLVYIEILLHWMVLNGVCIRSQDRVSLWESLVGDIGYDFISHQQQRHGHHHRTSKISSAFWPLLLQFLNKILGELPEEDKYTMVNKHFMDNDDEDTKSTPNGNEATKFSDSEYAFARSISTILGQEPDLPEEDYLRGLGWVDEIHGRFIKLDQQQEQVKQKNKEQDNKFDTIMKRKVKILDYGFTLVKVYVSFNSFSTKQYFTNENYYNLVAPG